MYVEIFVNGAIQKTWHFDNDELPDHIDEVANIKRSERWKAMMMNCKIESGLTQADTYDYEMFIKIRARIQPDEFTDEDMKEFEKLINKKRLKNAIVSTIKKINSTAK